MFLPRLASLKKQSNRKPDLPPAQGVFIKEREKDSGSNSNANQGQTTSAQGNEMSTPPSVLGTEPLSATALPLVSISSIPASKSTSSPTPLPMSMSASAVGSNEDSNTVATPIGGQ